MARYVFTSFRFALDYWRAQMVRNMGAVEGNRIANQNEWEDVKKKGDKAVEDWIDQNMKGKSCNVVLIGSQTAGRKFVQYEIKKAWNDKKGVLGIYIHKLKNKEGDQTSKGNNPFDDIKVGNDKLSTIVKTYNPPQLTSDGVYRHIEDNIEDWIEDAIKIRNNQ